MFSDITSSSDSFNTLEYWLESHPVSFSPEEWQDKQFNESIGIARYPQFVKSENIRTIINSRLPEKAHGQKSMFKCWQNALRPEQLEEHDRYEFELYFMHIFCSWASFCTQTYKQEVMRPQMQRQDVIHPSRKGLDNLIELAFQLRSGAEHMWLQAPELALSGYPDAVDAEGVTTMSLPMRCQSIISRERREFNFSWSYINKPQSVVTFVYVVAEDNSNLARKEALRRLQMCFYSCHMHRRAICCSDGQVFGGLAFGIAIQLFVSFWNGDVIEVRPIFEPFTPSFLDSFVECYFTLCRVSEHQAEYFRKEFERWNDQGVHRLYDIEESAKNPWRRENRWEIESSDGSHDENVWENSAMSGASVPRARPAVDPRVELTVERIRRGHPPQGGFSLTRTHKKAFDILTEAEKSEEFHSIQSPSTWAEETHKYRDEYEDPAPCSYDDDGEEDVSMSGSDQVGAEVAPYFDDNSDDLSSDGSDDVGSVVESTVRSSNLNGDLLTSGGCEPQNRKRTSCASEDFLDTTYMQKSINTIITQDSTSSVLISISKRGGAANNCAWNFSLINVVPSRRARSDT